LVARDRREIEEVTMSDEARFQKLVAMMDSDQSGERQTALDMIHDRRGQNSWPKFVDLLRPFTDTVPLAQYQKLESDLAGWIATADQLARNNKKLWAMLGLKESARRVGIAAAVIAAAFGGYRVLLGGYHFLWPDARAASELSQAMLVEMARWKDWPRPNAVGDSSPVTHNFSGQIYWVVIRGEIDKTSRVDDYGRPVSRYCQHYHAAKAEYDPAPPASYLTPQPYSWLGRMKWPEIAMQCW
jgi:hypothetical protein